MLILRFWKGPGLGDEQSPFQVFVVPPKTHKKVTLNGLGQNCDKYDPWWRSDHAGSGHCDRHSSKFLGQRLDLFHLGGRVSRNWRPCKSNEFLHCPTWNMFVYACNRNRQFRVIFLFTEWPQCGRLYQEIGFVEPCSCSSIFDLKRLDSFPLSLKRFDAQRDKDVESPSPSLWFLRVWPDPLLWPVCCNWELFCTMFLMWTGGVKLRLFGVPGRMFLSSNSGRIWLGFHSHGGTPIAGWFISWKSQYIYIYM